MDYKKLSRVADSKIVDEEIKYFFYDGFDDRLDENLTFDELVDIVKGELNPSGSLYQEIEADPQAIWDIEWDLIGGDFEQIYYGTMDEVDEYRHEEPSKEEIESKNLDKLLQTTKDKAVLEKYSTSSDRRLRSWVAFNSSTPENILLKLAKDKEWLVRSNVAANKAITPEVARILVKDPEWYGVRRSLALNENIPDDVLDNLLNDEHVYVREAAKIGKDYRK